jgi:hypothetical protein
VSDPAELAKLEQLAALKSSYERTDFVMKAGRATMPTAKPCRVYDHPVLR